MNWNGLRVWFLCLPLAFLHACGGGAAGGGSGGPLGGGIEGSGDQITSSGAVTDKGSIFVNDVEYDLTGATITIDGDPATEADLDVGGIVIVEGELDANGTTGTATRVTAGIAVAGPISAVDLALSQITVLGQSVEIDSSTIIESGAADQLLGGLQVDDDVEVSGFANSTGLVTARRIGPRPANSPLKVTGFVADLDTTQKHFTVNGQVVDYAAAMLVGLDAEHLAGAPVRVTASEPPANDVALKAEQVVFRDLRLPGAVGNAAALQGWVNQFTSESDFAVDGYPVVTTPATTIKGSQDEYLGHIRLDAFVFVKGKLIEGGVVEAAQIEINNLVAMDTVIMGVDTDGFVSAALVPWARPGCQLQPYTAITIDGRRVSADGLGDGDVATIQVHLEGEDGQTERNSNCWIVDVAHNVRGPLESKATGSASIMVMGQRVWFDTSYQGFAGLDDLAVGDMVEVSGHSTATGDILATGIHAASPRPGYQVIGLARNVDADGDRFVLGELLIDYADASVGGFPNGEPAEGERVLVTAGTAPSDGMLRADLVKYAVKNPRGANYNFLMPFGLITRYAAPDDLDVEGRFMVRLPNQVGTGSDDPNDAFWASGYCDADKLHADLRATFYSVGGPYGRPLYWTAQCPSGRRRDGLNGNYYDQWAPLLVIGPVESVDLVDRSVTVLGVDLMLHPATLLTRYQASSDPDAVGGVSIPAFLEQVNVGERVRVRVSGNPTEGIRTVDDIWLDDAASHEFDLYLEGDLQALADPDMVLYSGVHVRVTADTEIRSSGCETTTYDVAAFFANASPGIRLQIPVVRAGDELLAQSIYWDSGCWDY
jgi:hypothetical protein